MKFQGRPWHSTRCLWWRDPLRRRGWNNQSWDSREVKTCVRLNHKHAPFQFPLWRCNFLWLAPGEGGGRYSVFSLTSGEALAAACPHGYNYLQGIGGPIFTVARFCAQDATCDTSWVEHFLSVAAAPGLFLLGYQTHCDQNWACGAEKD